MRVLKRNQVINICRLGGCENLVCEKKKFLFYTFINSEPQSQYYRDLRKVVTLSDRFNKKFSYGKHTMRLVHNITISVNQIILMHCQCHFGKVKSSVDTGAAAMVCYAIYRSGNDG